MKNIPRILAVLLVGFAVELCGPAPGVRPSSAAASTIAETRLGNSNAAAESTLLRPGRAHSPAGMVLIPAGTYQPLYRDANDGRVAPVKAFYLDVLPVTVQDFLEFVRANPQWQRSHVKAICADQCYLRNWSSDLEPGPNAPLASPVTDVSWFAAESYAAWKNKRLPTTAEWEHAASAGITSAIGANDPEFKRRVIQWYSSPSPRQLPAVGLDRANYWGVHDLHGLIWEWVADFNDAAGTASTGDSANKRTAPNRERFCGGGAAGATDLEDFPAFMRYGFRSSLRSDYCVHNLGFRCAKDL